MSIAHRQLAESVSSISLKISNCQLAVATKVAIKNCAFRKPNEVIKI